MIFKAPEWFLLFPMVILLGWYWRSLECWRPLRVASLSLLIFILAQPQIKRFEEGMDLWVLLDRSASAEGLVDKNITEWKKLLEKSKKSRHDKIFFVDYASEVVPQGSSESGIYLGAKTKTKTRLALENTLAQSNKEKASRILLFTDGYSTEALRDIGEKLKQENVPLDYRILERESVNDYRITKFALPHRVHYNEPFFIELEIDGKPDGEVPLSILRDGQLLQQTTAQVKQGKALLHFSDRIARPGSYRYQAVITPTQDAYLGNNREEEWIEIVGGPRLLLLSTYLEDPLEKVLQAQGLEVEKVSALEDLTLGALSGVKAVIFNNVPAYKIPTEFLASVDFFVRAQGGGLLMVGGKQSFGAGGYFGSAIDALLPVSMELKSDHRKLAMAMAIVLDRSGSMSAPVADGLTKMSLANEGAARSIELLGEQDQVAVSAVDSESHRIIGLSRVGPSREKLIDRVRRIQSRGGGIYVYTGLQEAWRELKKAQVGQRHIILFSDAADSEEPGEYRQLIKEITENSGSVSVIGLGSKKDQDAAFLQDIAQLGKGRIFFTTIPKEIPFIFSQETVAVARSAFLEDPVSVQATGLWHEISPQAFPWMPLVDGYNLSYLREGATAALVSQDEYDAPLVAFSQKGIGRTAAVSFPMGGAFSTRVRQWDRYGDFVQTLSRWLMGEEIPPGIGLRSSLEGVTLTVDLFYSEEWNQRLAKNAPKIFLSEREGGEGHRALTWKKMSPGHFRVSKNLAEGELVRGVVQVGNHALPFGPLIIGGDTEWSFDMARREELKQAAALSGGGEVLKLKDVWESPRAARYADIGHWFIYVLLVIILLEALITRMGWRLPDFGTFFQKKVSFAKREPAISKTGSLSQERRTEERSSPLLNEEQQKKKESGAKKMRSRFARAKRGGR